MRIVFLTLMAIALAGCASRYNAAKEGDSPLGGGYYEDPVRDGVVYIQAKTNFAPYVNSAGAHRLWRERAEHYCGSSDFQELGMSGWHYKSGPSFLFVPYIIAVQEGFAVCGRSGLSVDAAEAAIRPRCARYPNTSICATH